MPQPAEALLHLNFRYLHILASGLPLLPLRPVPSSTRHVFPKECFPNDVCTVQKGIDVNLLHLVPLLFPRSIGPAFVCP